MAIRNTESSLSRVEQSRNEVNEAVKRKVAVLLERLGVEVDDDSQSGGEYLSVYLSSQDPKTGLDKGLLVVTDREFGSNDDAAYRRPKKGMPFSYCTKVMNCVFVEELSPGNLNVKELDWDVDRGAPCLLSEEGLAVVTVPAVIGGTRGLLARYTLAPYFDVSEKDFILSNDIATGADVTEFFNNVLAPGVIDGMKPVDFGALRAIS